MTDPRIARIATLADALIADHLAATGRTPATADDLRAALADLDAGLARDNKRRRHAEHQAARMAFYRGRGSR